MTLIDEIFETDITAKLNNISVANEYLNDVSILDGFMVHYVNDLLKGKDGLSFPCLAAQPADDTVDLQKNHTSGTVSRTIKVVGAVSVKDRTKVNANLNSLVFDVRKALCVDKNDPIAKRATKSKAVILGGVKYELPDSNDQYAYFEMTVTIEYVEKWK